MLLTKEIEVGWNSTNRKHYEKLGYKYEWRTRFIVPVEHLTENSHVKVEFLCDYCKKEKILRVWQSYTRSINESLIQKDCCRKCWSLKLQETMEKKYSVENANDIPSTINKIKLKMRMSYTEVNNRFIKAGYELCLTEQEYNGDLSISSKTPLQFICHNHPDEDTQISIDFLKRKYCALELQTGENHPNWKGGVSSINQYLRERLKEWKTDSLINNNYKCDITKQNGSLEIHHLYSFNKIVSETFTNLKIHDKTNLQIGSFTEDELEMIKSMFFKIHSKYGLGVCLKPSVHSLFHKVYGYDNTLEQYEDFKDKWSEYKDIEA